MTHDHQTVGSRSGRPRATPAWQRVAAAQPRIAKYQSKSDREFPVVRLTPRPSPAG
jgi:hypothetical protein